MSIKNYFTSIKEWVKNNRVEAIFLLGIILIGGFFRLYRIDEYMTFLGDEGRDVIIVRRLLVNADPILIGPGTSIGNMYLGPIYYYMMAGALLLANFSPVGPAIQIALLGILTILFTWYVGREWFGSVAGLIASSLYAISPTVITYSRSSWNPNIMPFFALLTIYSIWRVWKYGKWNWIIVTGVAYAFVLQSHYLGLLLLPTIGIFWFLSARKEWEDDKKRLTTIYRSIVTIAIFLLLMSPLVIFDARHGWRNFDATKKFFTERQTTVSARPWNAIPKMWPQLVKVNTRLLAGRNEVGGRVVSFAMVSLVIWLVIFKRVYLKSLLTNYLLLASWIGFALIGLGLYKQEIYDHYFGFFFPAPFLLLGGIAQNLKENSKSIFKIGLISAFVYLIFINLAENPLKYFPSGQLARTQEIAKKIMEESKGKKFNLAVIAERNYEDAYQYFLELWKVPVVEIDAQRADETITDQLFVVCELPKENCQPTSNPKAEIANFGWSVIEKQWEVSGIQLFKLGHTR